MPAGRSTYCSGKPTGRRPAAGGKRLQRRSACARQARHGHRGELQPQGLREGVQRAGEACCSVCGRTLVQDCRHACCVHSCGLWL